jgi:hypothetical protein
MRHVRGGYLSLQDYMPHPVTVILCTGKFILETRGTVLMQGLFQNEAVAGAAP